MSKTNPMCRICSDELNEDNWYPASRKNGDYICIECHKKERNLQYVVNRDKENAQQRLYRKNNSDKINAHQRLYREANRDKIKAQNSLYREKNRDKINAKARLQRKNNPEKMKAHRKEGHIPMSEKKYCKCGCGTVISDSATWVLGHNSKDRICTAETRKKISDSEKGKIVTAETRKKISDALKGKPSPTKGKIVTAETRKKLSDAATSKTSPMKGIPRTDETKMRASATKQGISYDEWESFACESLYCPKFNEACRESNREKYDRKCFICGMTEEENGQKLSVHHVDMRKSQGCDSNWKLVPLCKHHHATSHNDELIARLGYLLDDTILTE